MQFNDDIRILDQGLQSNLYSYQIPTLYAYFVLHFVFLFVPLWIG